MKMGREDVIEPKGGHSARNQCLIFGAGILLTGCLWLWLGRSSLSDDAASLSPQARSLVVVFSIALTLWISEVIPLAVTSLAIIPLLVLSGVTDSRTAISGFASPVVMFVLAMFILAGVMRQVGLDRRLAMLFLSKAGTSPRRVLFAFMAGTATLSSFISDLPACLVFMTLGIRLLDRVGVQPGSDVFGRSLMMGVPIAALIGGIATPAGSSVNVLGIQQISDFAEKYDLDASVTFLQWTALGVPMVLVLIPSAWFILCKCCRIQGESIPGLEHVELQQQERIPLDQRQVMTIGILATMMVLWILGSWITWLDVTLVAILGAVVVFLPGVRLISWRQAEDAIGWESLLMIGGVVALGKASMETGLAEALVTGSIDGIQSWNPLWIVALISGVTVIIHLPLPIAPVVNVVLIPPVALLALDARTGEMLHNPILFALPVAFTASCAFLLPLDAVCLLTYSRGYYRMHHMLLPGALISLCWIIVMTIAMLFIAPLVGLI